MTPGRIKKGGTNVDPAAPFGSVKRRNAWRVRQIRCSKAFAEVTGREVEWVAYHDGVPALTGNTLDGVMNTIGRYEAGRARPSGIRRVSHGILRFEPFNVEDLA